MYEAADKRARIEAPPEALRRRRVARFDDVFEREPEASEHASGRHDQRKPDK